MTDPFDPVRAILSAPEDIDPGDVDPPPPRTPEDAWQPAGPDDMPPEDRFGPPPPDGPDGPVGGDGGDGEPPPPEREGATFPLNDIGNGRRFALYFGDRSLHVPRVGWHLWTGQRWEKDPDKIGVRRLAHQVPDLMEREMAHLRLSDRKQALVERRDDLEAQLARIEAIKPADRSEADMAQGREADRLLREIAEITSDFAKRGDRHFTFAKSTGNTAKLTAMLDEAAATIRGNRPMSRPLDELDAEDLAVNCASGTLRFTVATGTPDRPFRVAEARLDPHEREDLITKCMPVVYDPTATAPAFDAFLARIQPRAEMRAFLRRWLGLSMTAIPEQRLALFYGGGANGKSVLVDLIARVLGDYAATAKIESLTGQSKRGGADATPDLIPLMGARLVRASEPEQGERLKEGTIKELTGGEPILVRALHSDFVEVKPRFKLTLSGNHKPEIRGTDYGIWRRVMLIPFEVQIPENERDPKLGEKLWAEAPGILNWLAEGLLDYLERGGLDIPEEVAAATQSYREESDPVGVFLDECCEVSPDPGAFTRTKDLVEAFNFWMVERGDTPWRQRTVMLRIKDKAGQWRDRRSGLSFAATKRSVAGYVGLRLTDLFAQRMHETAGEPHAPGARTHAPNPDLDDF